MTFTYHPRADDAEKRFYVKNVPTYIHPEIALRLESACVRIIQAMILKKGSSYKINQIEAIVRACRRFNRGIHGGGPNSIKNNWPGVIWDLRTSLADMSVLSTVPPYETNAFTPYAHMTNAFIEVTKFKTAILVRVRDKKTHQDTIFDKLGTDTFNIILKIVKEVRATLALTLTRTPSSNLSPNLSPNPSPTVDHPPTHQAAEDTLDDIAEAKTQMARMDEYIEAAISRINMESDTQVYEDYDEDDLDYVPTHYFDPLFGDQDQDSWGVGDVYPGWE